MIDVCVRSNRMETAWHLLSEMEQVGLKPDNFTYSTLIKGIQPVGSVVQNMQFKPHMKAGSCKN